MPHTATITAKTGPDRINTAMAFGDVKNFAVDLRTMVLSIENIPVPPTGPGSGDTIREYDLTGVTTFTVTITAGVYALVIS